MNFPNASIIGHVQHNALGQAESVWFEWDGPRDGVAAVERRKDRRIGGILMLGALRLRIVDDDFYGSRHLVMLDGWRARIRPHVFRVLRLADLAYRRLIVTAAVWGLADYSSALLPSYLDLHVVKRFKAMMAHGATP
jgi:hypothetical protein